MSALDPDARDWLTHTGFTVQDEALWFAALTHGSMGETRDYERLEFLGDRVLGLAIADWLYAQSEAPEGKLAQRLNAIVSRAMCAQVARGIGRNACIAQAMTSMSSRRANPPALRRAPRGRITRVP